MVHSATRGYFPQRWVNTQLTAMAAQWYLAPVIFVMTDSGRVIPQYAQDYDRHSYANISYVARFLNPLQVK